MATGQGNVGIAVSLLEVCSLSQLPITNHDVKIQKMDLGLTSFILQGDAPVIQIELQKKGLKRG